jgi:putative heme iron utilization protein
VSTDEEKMEIIRKIILKHIGKANAIKAKFIATKIGLSGEDDTHIGTRNLITKLVKQGMPIGACDNGYFLLETQDEVDEYGQKLNNRIVEIYERIMHIQNNFNAYYHVQNKSAVKPVMGEDEDEDIL